MYNLPLSAEQLDYAIRRGLGRAFLHARKHWRESDDQILIRRCLVDDRFDRQVEEPRHEWLYELISLAHNATVILEKIMSELEEDLCEELRQGFGIVLIEANDGDEHFLDRLIKLVDKRPLALYADHVGQLACLTEPILFQNWANLQPDSDLEEHIFVFNETYNLIIKKHGADALDLSDPVIKRIAEYEYVPTNKPDPTFNDVMADIDTEDHPAGIYTVTRKLTDGQSDIIEARLNEEDRPTAIKNLLYLLTRRGSAKSLDRLLELTHHADENVCWRACQVLSMSTDDRIADRGREMADHGDRRPAGLKLLVRNHALADAGLFEEVFDDADDDDDRHRVAWALQDAYGHTPNDRLRSLMIRFYDEGPCARCRNRILEALKETGHVPGWMEAEASDNFS